MTTHPRQHTLSPALKRKHPHMSWNQEFYAKSVKSAKANIDKLATPHVAGGQANLPDKVAMSLHTILDSLPEYDPASVTIYVKTAGHIGDADQWANAEFLVKAIRLV